MSSIPPPPQEPPQYYQQPQFQQPKKSNVGLIVAIVLGAGACLVVPIFAAILFPVFAQAKLSAKKSDALSNIKQSATSVLIYQADHDDLFPPNMGDSDSLKTSLDGYLNDYGSGWEILKTPTEGNPNLSGKNSVDIRNAQSTIMLYCIPKELSGKAVLAAADSSARAVNASSLNIEISGNTYRVPSE